MRTHPARDALEVDPILGEQHELAVGGGVAVAVDELHERKALGSGPGHAEPVEDARLRGSGRRAVGSRQRSEQEPEHTSAWAQSAVGAVGRGSCATGIAPADAACCACNNT